MLLKAIGAFFILVYIHIIYSQSPATCLAHIKNDWPRDGILRVEILKNGAQLKTPKVIKNYYADDNGDLTVLRSNSKDGFVSIDPSATTLPHEGEKAENFSQMLQTQFVQNESQIAAAVEATEFLSVNFSSAEANKTDPEQPKYPVEGELKSDVPEVEKILNAVWSEDQYIVEYSLEYGFLRLSAATRQRLNIPVWVVTLDPQTDKCFGDTFSKFILQEFLGYDDLLMASVKVLAEQEDNRGYLRFVNIL